MDSARRARPSEVRQWPDWDAVGETGASSVKFRMPEWKIRGHSAGYVRIMKSFRSRRGHLAGIASLGSLSPFILAPLGETRTFPVIVSRFSSLISNIWRCGEQAAHVSSLELRRTFSSPGTERKHMIEGAKAGSQLTFQNTRSPVCKQLNNSRDRRKHSSRRTRLFSKCAAPHAQIASSAGK